MILSMPFDVKPDELIRAAKKLKLDNHVRVSKSTAICKNLSWAPAPISLSS